jgi:hypothetical protein
VSRHLRVVLLAAATCAACTTADVATVTEQATVIDSAGITIVQNHRPVWGDGEGWKVSVEPVLVIGDTILTGEASRAYKVARLQSGEVVVLTDREGRWFDTSGALVRTFAPRGEGPGEFRSARGLAVLPGDTIAVGSDGPGGKIGLYSPEGVLVREIITDWERIRALGRWGECSSELLPDLSSTGCQFDSTIPYSETNRPSLVVRPGETSPGAGLLRQLRRTYVVPMSADTAYSLGIAFWREVQIVDLGEGVHATIYHPFHAQSTMSAGGLPMRIASATNPHWEIEVRSSTGTLLQRIRRDGGRRVPTEAERLAADSALRSPKGRVFAPDPVLRARAIEAVITPDSLPGHAQVLVTSRGEILSRHWSLWGSRTPSVFDVFDRDGRWQGTLQLPAYFQLAEVGEDYLLGIQYDDDDVQTVVVYGLER